MSTLEAIAVVVQSTREYVPMQTVERVLRLHQETHFDRVRHFHEKLRQAGDVVGQVQQEPSQIF